MKELEFKARSNNEMIMIKDGRKYSFNVQIADYGAREKLREAYKELRENEKG